MFCQYFYISRKLSIHKTALEMLQGLTMDKLIPQCARFKPALSLRPSDFSSSSRSDGFILTMIQQQSKYVDVNCPFADHADRGEP